MAGERNPRWPIKRHKPHFAESYAKPRSWSGACASLPAACHRHSLELRPSRIGVNMKPKELFGLAVRLLGLVFLYLGLKAATPLLDLETFEGPDSNGGDIVNGILPVVFNLAIAWWLLGGGLLVRRAYPESRKNREPGPSRTEAAATAPATESAPVDLPDMDRAEKKLAALVEKPKPNTL